jgi:hypothetical protein
MIIIHGEEIDSVKKENLLARRNIDELHLVLVSFLVKKQKINFLSPVKKTRNLLLIITTNTHKGSIAAAPDRACRGDQC